MSRECFGQKFKVGGEWFWRCVEDGSVIGINLPDGSMCPSCHRPVEITVAEVDTRTVIHKEICFRDGRRNWLPFRTMIL
jgi:uncharacterized OB-fold protein